MSRFTLKKHFAALQPLFALGKSIRAGSLEPALRELVDMRVSQIYAGTSEIMKEMMSRSL